MNSMNAIRLTISIFLVALMAVSVAGWIWAGDKPAETLIGARIVLAACGLSSIGALALLWSVKRPQSAE